MENKELIYEMRKAKNVWLTFLLLGWSYGSLGQIGKQIAFYVTFGGFGLWTLYVLFTLSSKIKKYNNNLKIELGIK
tara:strand:- start:1171 stop:1398 length:228 start_codon:yes stop_codon:yes gene_type:complete